MRKYIFILVATCLISCVKERDQFIPNNEDYPTNALKSLIPSKSLQVNLKHNESYELTTANNSYLEIDNGVFAASLENNSSYDLKVIELTSYVDYILQNVDHESNIGITNTLYSFYISAEQDGNPLDVQEGKSMKIRFTSENMGSNLALGYGQLKDNILKWDYYSSNLNSRVSYIAWETIDENGQMKTEYGYEIIVNSQGWYSLVTKEGVSNAGSSICLNYNPIYTNENTASYLLMNDKNYISKLKMINDNSSSFCLWDLPATDEDPYTIISISKTEDGQYHYFKTDVEMDGSADEINVFPSELNFDELRTELEKL